MTYVQVGHKAYGENCEWIGCGWKSANTDVHHIYYQEHQVLEDEARKTKGEHYQLPKSILSKELSVLCPNHHRFVHFKDMGKDILQYIPPRK